MKNEGVMKNRGAVIVQSKFLYISRVLKHYSKEVSIQNYPNSKNLVN